MSEHREPTTEQAALLVAQAHWLAERYESNAEGFLSRAGILLGLLGVEVALIAPAQAALWSRLLALGLLVVPGMLLLFVFRRVDVAYPSHEELSSAVFGVTHPTWLVVEQTLKVLDPERSLTAQLKAEAERRYFWCTWGLYALIGVQPVVAVVLAIGVWS